MQIDLVISNYIHKLMGNTIEIFIQSSKKSYKEMIATALSHNVTNCHDEFLLNWMKFYSQRVFEWETI